MSSLPTDSSRPLFKQIEIFSILTVWLYISTVSTFLNIRASYWSASSGFRLLGEIPAGAITHFHEERDIAFTSDFCDNHSHPASPASLYLTSPRPRPTRPRVPYCDVLKSLFSRPQVPVPTHASRCPRPLVPVPLLYTANLEHTHINCRGYWQRFLPLPDLSRKIEGDCSQGNQTVTGTSTV